MPTLAIPPRPTGLNNPLTDRGAIATILNLTDIQKANFAAAQQDPNWGVGVPNPDYVPFMSDDDAHAKADAYNKGAKWPTVGMVSNIVPPSEMQDLFGVHIPNDVNYLPSPPWPNGGGWYQIKSQEKNSNPIGDAITPIVETVALAAVSAIPIAGPLIAAGVGADLKANSTPTVKLPVAVQSNAAPTSTTPPAQTATANPAVGSSNTTANLASASAAVQSMSLKPTSTTPTNSAPAPNGNAMLTPLLIGFGILFLIIKKIFD